MAISKNKNGESAGSKLSNKERRALQQRQQQRQQQLLLGALAVVLLIGVIAFVVISLQPPEAVIADGIQARYADFESQKLQGTTPDGYPFLGAANAPVTIEQFGSFSCPHCLEYHDSIFVNILDEIKAGRAKFVFIPEPGYGGFNSEPATRGALCAGQQGKFWDVHDVLYDWQQRYGTGMNDSARLSALAGKLGLDTGAFNSCLNSAATTTVIDSANTEATKRGVAATPTIFINGTQVSPAVAGAQDPTLGELRGIIEQGAVKTS
jgi:protein-disulfide isomerase